jgi:hypothetical protein
MANPPLQKYVHPSLIEVPNNPAVVCVDFGLTTTSHVLAIEFRAGWDAAGGAGNNLVVDPLNDMLPPSAGVQITPFVNEILFPNPLRSFHTVPEPG